MGALQQANSSDPLLDIDLEPEVEMDSENDSDWSAHMDGEIGWWGQRSRRHRSTNARRSARRQQGGADSESQVGKLIDLCIVPALI